MQTNNRDKFLSTDFGLKEFDVNSRKERVKRYRTKGDRYFILDNEKIL